MKKFDISPHILTFFVGLFIEIVSGTSLIVTGDVNLNPSLPFGTQNNYTYIWGDMIKILKGADVLAINHESTLAEIPLSNPNVIQFEDPLNYIDTYGELGVGVDFMAVANNHQFDFSYQGIQNSINNMQKNGITYSGIGKSSQIRLPRIVKKAGRTFAFFTMVVDECAVWPNGTLYLDECTCGSNAGPPPYYQCYLAGTNNISTGLWYNWGIQTAFIQEVVQVIGNFKKQNPSVFVVAFLHVGPNFQWEPSPEREMLLRNISTVADLVWGTSSHHIQRLEIFGARKVPIIYGLGDLLFRHAPGVDDFCPILAIPCAQYRPRLALSYQFEIVDGPERSPRVDLASIVAWPSWHSDHQAFLVTDPNDLDWIHSIFNELSNPYGANATFDRQANNFKIQVTV